jgi:hypothetical protein
MQFTVNAREATRIPGPGNPETIPARLASYLADHIVIGSTDSDCKSTGVPKALASRPGYVQIEMTWNCSRLRSLSVGADLAAEHVHFASMESPPVCRNSPSESHWAMVTSTTGNRQPKEGKAAL